MKLRVEWALGPAIGLHFAFVLSVILHFSDWLERQPSAVPLTSAMAYYDSLTFSNRNFGFFAPNISGNCTVDIIETEADGRIIRRQIGSHSREMEIRLYAMVGAFVSTDDSLDLLARSLALNAMNANPSSVQVDVEIRQNVLPSMAQYRAGRRIYSRLVYRTTFRSAHAEGPR